MGNTLKVSIVDTPEQAPNYSRDTLDIRGVVITEAVIIKNGTVAGKPTVDFKFVTADGSEFVAIMNGSLVLQLAAMIQGATQ